MNPVSERYLLIERLDAYVLYGVLAFCAIGIGIWFLSKKYKRMEKLYWWVDVPGFALVVIGVLVYLYWRFEIAWKGIYYP